MGFMRTVGPRASGMQSPHGTPLLYRPLLYRSVEGYVLTSHTRRSRVWEVNAYVEGYPFTLFCDGGGATRAAILRPSAGSGLIR